MMKALLKYFLHGFGIASEHPVELSNKEVQNLIEIQQIEEPAPGQILQLAKWCIDYLKKNETELSKVLLNDLKRMI